jgi:hypothetical protein
LFNIVVSLIRDLVDELLFISFVFNGQSQPVYEPGLPDIES